MADKGNDNEDRLEFEGYARSRGRKIVSWIGMILSLGILRLIFYWMPAWRLKATHYKTSLVYAQKLLVTDVYEKKRTQFVCEINEVDLCTVRRSHVNVSSREMNESSKFVDEQFESIFDDELEVYFIDGTSRVLGDTVRIVIIKQLTYIWDDESLTFKRIAGLGPGLNHQDIHHYPQHTSLQRFLLKMVYGNNLMLVPDTAFVVIVLREMISPFNVFQYINAILKGITSSWLSCWVILGFTILILLASAAQAKVNQMRLRKSAKAGETHFKVFSDNEIHSVTAGELVPGDRVILPEKGCKIPCDGIILSGFCLVNESMLTGESVPQSKTPLPMLEANFMEKDMSNHAVYTGTTMLRTHGTEPVQILVIRTGFSTSQGNIIRSILYPRPLEYSFENSILKFCILIFILSLIGALINAIVEIIHKEDAGQIAMYTLTIAVMLIPTVMPILTATKLVGIKRLAFNKIYCVQPGAFNLAGTADCTCFDKTGTLTEDGLDLHHVIPSNNSIFMDPASFDTPPRAIEDTIITRAMAACHSIMEVEDDNGDKVLTGDPIDLKMLEWTNWDFFMQEDNKGQRHPTVIPRDQYCSIRIIHQNQFSSKLQRMSVIVQCSDEPNLRLYCKGSPEKITSLSHPHTVPTNFNELLEQYTRRGFRVLALGTRYLSTANMRDIQRTPRKELETELEFVGLLAFENKLKPETTPTITELKNASFKVVMITGDNQQTAESVARECGIISQHQTILELIDQDNQLKCIINKPDNNTMASSYGNMEHGIKSEHYVFSVTGPAWKLVQEKYSNIMPQILIKTAVFARMSSDQKKQVVEGLSSIGYGVVMCGDGANDCGAIRAADVGISLSQMEASSAASFTSQNENISAVIEIIRNGRCSLATSVSFFKYMILTSTMTTIAERFMQGLNTELTGNQRLFLDTITLTNLAVWFPRAGEYRGPLPVQTPIDTVLSFYVIFSLITNLLICLSFQIGSFLLVQNFSWYKQPSEEGSFECYAMFTTVGYQILVLCIAHSPGFPFRQPIYRTYTLTFMLLALFILDTIITFNPTASLVKWLTIRLPPNFHFPLIVLSFSIGALIILVLLERFLVDKSIYKRCKRYPYLIKTKTKQKYIEIQEQINYSYNWVTQNLSCAYKNVLT